MRIKKLIIILAVIFIFINCSEDFEIVEDLSNKNYQLLNQDSSQVKFPELIKGKVAVVGYIFTNCPDICPLTTNNMRLIRELIEKENIKNVNSFQSVLIPKLIDQVY